MREKQNKGWLRGLESAANSLKIKTFLTIALIGTILMACTPVTLATHSEREIEVKVTIENNLDVNINPELPENAMLRVTAADGSSVNLSDNIEDIPITVESVDIRPEDLDSQQYTSTLYVIGEGYKEESLCRWKTGMIANTDGTFTVKLSCEGE